MSRVLQRLSQHPFSWTVIGMARCTIRLELTVVSFTASVRTHQRRMNCISSIASFAPAKLTLSAPIAE